MCFIHTSYSWTLYTPNQAELTQATAQAEDLDLKNSTAERNVKSLKEQIEELQDKLSEETRAKIAANNKQKQLEDEVERLNAQLEDEEEAKTGMQNKLVQINQQVTVLIQTCMCVWGPVYTTCV